MTLEKLNILANIYRKERTNETFQDVYDELVDARKINRSLILQEQTGDEADALEIFHDVLMRVLDKDVEFGRFFHRSLKNARIDFFRKRKRERTRQRSLDAMTDTDEGAATPKILRSDYNLEEDAIITKEADHRQVIDFLVRNGKPDATTSAIVEAFRNAHPSATRNEIAKEMGLHHNVVKRKLTALSRRYDESRFGDIRDLLAI